MRRSPRKMNFYHNRHRSDGKLIEREDRVTTSDFENNYTNTEKNLSNNTIQIPKENYENDDEKYFEDSNKLINTMDILLKSLQKKINIPQKQIIYSSSNIYGDELFKKNTELRNENKILNERLKNLQSQITPTSTNNNINSMSNNININSNQLMIENDHLDYENYQIQNKINKLLLKIKNKKIQNNRKITYLIKTMVDSMEELKILFGYKNNIEDELTEITTESKSDMNEFYEGNSDNYESDKDDYESENEDSKIREQDLYYDNNRNQRIKSTREKNYKDYQILNKINERDDKQRNINMPTPNDNFLYQNLNQNNY